MSSGSSPELEQFVQSEIASGHLVDRAAVVDHALRLCLLDRGEAIEGINAGLADVAGGRTQPLGAALVELRSESKPDGGA